ncbi:hypothetical protein [Salinispora arenicola]|uniref:hypothetical protein n=1 Tax=Salinispora arenicola TaxID=168697 RepID=UPI0003810014|nr:hypothetical protein [Salinispora arenicola]
MSITVFALTAADQARDMLLAEPAPVAPPGLQAKTDLFWSWLKWGGNFLGIVGIIVAGIMMMVGRRNRSSMAADGASGLPWIIGGLALVALAGGIVSTVLDA